MRLRTILIGVGVVVLAAIGGLTIAVLRFDANEYRAYVAEQLRSVTGREVNLRGPASLALGLRPAVTAEDVVLGNVPGGSRPEMLRIRRLEAEVELLPLIFSRQVKVHRLTLVGADLLLETDAQGRGNWLIGAAPSTAPAAPQAQPPQPAASVPPGAPRSLPEIADFSIRESVVAFFDRAANNRVTLQLERARVRDAAGDSPIRVEANGRLQDMPFDLDGQFGSLAALLANAAPWPAALTLRVGDAVTLRVAGTVADPLGTPHPDLSVIVDAPEIARLAALVGRQSSELGPLHAEARVSGTPARVFALNNIRMEFGRREGIAGRVTGSITDSMAMRGADLMVALEIREIASLSGLVLPGLAEPMPRLPESGRLSLEARLTEGQGGTSIPQLRLRFGRPERVNATIEGSVAEPMVPRGIDLRVRVEGPQLAAINDLRLPGMPALDLPALGQFRIQTRLGDNFALRELQVDLGADERLRITAAGAILNPLQQRGVNLNVQLRAPDVAMAARQLGVTAPFGGALAFQGRISDASESRYRVQGLRLTALGTETTGDATVGFRPRPFLGGDLAIGRLDVAALGGGRAGSGTGQAPAAAPRASGGRLFSDAPLPFASLAAADAELRLRIAQLVGIGPPMRNVDTTMLLRGGELNVRSFSGETAGGRIAGTLAANAQTTAVNGRVELRGADAGTLLREMQMAGDINGGRLDTLTEFRGSGRSLHAIVSGMSGVQRIIMREGSFNNRMMALLSTDLVTWAQSLTGDRGWSRVLCFVSHFDIREGTASSRVNLFHAQAASALTTGTIELGSEQLGLTIRPRPADTALLRVAPVVRVGGTLANPRVGFDAAGTAGAVVGAAGDVVQRVTETGGNARNLVEGLVRDAVGARQPQQQGRPAQAASVDVCALAINVANGQAQHAALERAIFQSAAPAAQPQQPPAQAQPDQPAQPQQNLRDQGRQLLRDLGRGVLGR